MQQAVEQRSIRAVRAGRRGAARRSQRGAALLRAGRRAASPQATRLASHRHTAALSATQVTTHAGGSSGAFHPLTDGLDGRGVRARMSPGSPDLFKSARGDGAGISSVRPRFCAAGDGARFCAAGEDARFCAAGELARLDIAGVCVCVVRASVCCFSFFFSSPSRDAVQWTGVVRVDQLPAGAAHTSLSLTVKHASRAAPSPGPPPSLGGSQVHQHTVVPSVRFR